MEDGNMTRTRTLLSLAEKEELILWFYDYPTKRLVELIYDEESLIEDWHTDYLPYLESQLYVALFRAVDTYNKGTEFSRSRRPRYFKSFVDKISKEHIKDVVIEMNAAFSRVEGTASRMPLKEDKELYDKLKRLHDGQSLLNQKKEEIK